MTTVELFAGAGGLALGFHKAGFTHKALIELDKDACASLRKNFNTKNVYHVDITAIKSFKELLKINSVDVISGGFPCQSFSYAGLGKGIEDSRGTLFYDMARAIAELKPKIVVAENVQGLVSHDGGETLKVIIDTFSRLGYIIKYEVLNSNDYGVAQKRKRLFIVGVRDDIYGEYGEFEFPDKLIYKPVLRDILLDVPDSPYTPFSEYKKKILEQVPPGGCWRDLPEKVAKEYMKKSYFLGGGRTGIARRLSLDEPSLTILTSPSQKQTERCHPIHTRPFTIRESARIQSFPDNWVFEGSISSQYKQIGNAVPVEMAYHIAQAIKAYMKGNNAL